MTQRLQRIFKENFQFAFWICLAQACVYNWDTNALKPSVVFPKINIEISNDFICRFCSRPFTLTCGHESIHLCNNAVQARYTNAERSSKLPTVIFFSIILIFENIYIFRFFFQDNMWDNKTFIQFLKENGAGDKWHSLIYPTMKKCLISMNSVSELNCILPGIRK